MAIVALTSHTNVADGVCAFRPNAGPSDEVHEIRRRSTIYFEEVGVRSIPQQPNHESIGRVNHVETEGCRRVSGMPPARQVVTQFGKRYSGAESGRRASSGGWLRLTGWTSIFRRSSCTESRGDRRSWCRRGGQWG